MGKGVTLSVEELKKLKEILDYMNLLIHIIHIRIPKKTIYNIPKQNT